MKIKKLDLFSFGLFLVPFDNLFIAPSKGWATLSPIIFFLYLSLHYRGVKKAIYRERRKVLLLLLLFAYQFVLILINGVHIKSLTDGIFTLGLGISFYLSLVIRYTIYNNDKNKDGEVLYAGYLAGFIYGLARLICMKFAKPLLFLFVFVEKRPYERLAFSFTEPSFISMHVFGVLFLFTVFFTDIKLIKKCIKLGMAFLVVTVIFGGSSRCVIDIAFFLILLMTHSIIVNSKHLIRDFTFIGVGLSSFPFLLEKFPRVKGIINKGVYADPSMASRWFRIDAVIRGFKKDLAGGIFGRGLGNIIIPLRLGYDDALSNYTSSYMKDVNTLGSSKEIDTILCMPIKIASEWGIALLIFFLIYIILWGIKREFDFFTIVMCLWLYVQFDSYAFYTFWLLLFAISDSSNKHKQSYFDVIEKMLSFRSRRLNCDKEINQSYQDKTFAS